jgi:hypothetical protein
VSLWSTLHSKEGFNVLIIDVVLKFLGYIIRATLSVLPN